ncbi:hypothetical protein QYM36_013675 [Artemia franciscana]|uniref:Uncharacterized protein n=1 Tax=Artemia franciscana TaxID=6661 RepID=A0AA88HLZ2_ARTSF|nr:hypothetical protein QYM36_013675 [Artemia franciscana]
MYQTKHKMGKPNFIKETKYLVTDLSINWNEEKKDQMVASPIGLVAALRKVFVLEYVWMLGESLYLNNLLKLETQMEKKDEGKEDGRGRRCERSEKV